MSGGGSSSSRKKKLPLLLPTLLLLPLLVTVAAEAQQLTCNDVVSSLSPCLNFVMGGNTAAALPPAGCCGGIKSLFAAAQTTPDRRTVCTCLKTVASSATTAQIGRAASLPSACGVTIPYKISPQLDCSKVN
ncbi:unnamed protein product [Cuscuta europaea]|uniref:Non-specific lipid-transfer protein n=1 Tax=Cuscuta europaea TaxID=41803 RepID=A0A9P0YU34_CUSEU|nr:unnamed protein product [Cuscuta europaea]